MITTSTGSRMLNFLALYQRPQLLTHEEWVNGRRYESPSARGRPPTPRVL
jgi:hypothetical protein